MRKMSQEGIIFLTVRTGIPDTKSGSPVRFAIEKRLAAAAKIFRK